MALVVATTNSGADWQGKKIVNADTRILQYIGVGTSNSPTASPNDTQLSAETGTRQAATITNPASRFTQFVTSILFPAGASIGEAGLFADLSGGLMYLRGTFDILVIPAGGTLDVTIAVEQIAV